MLAHSRGMFARSDLHTLQQTRRKRAEAEAAASFADISTVSLPTEMEVHRRRITDQWYRGQREIAAIHEVCVTEDARRQGIAAEHAEKLRVSAVVHNTARLFDSVSPKVERFLDTGKPCEGTVVWKLSDEVSNFAPPEYSKLLHAGYLYSTVRQGTANGHGANSIPLPGGWELAPAAPDVVAEVVKNPWHGARRFVVLADGNAYRPSDASTGPVARNVLVSTALGVRHKDFSWSTAVHILMRRKVRTAELHSACSACPGVVVAAEDAVRPGAAAGAVSDHFARHRVAVAWAFSFEGNKLDVTYRVTRGGALRRHPLLPLVAWCLRRRGAVPGDVLAQMAAMLPHPDNTAVAELHGVLGGGGV